jgi:superfamily II DNA or RNA helicase
MPKAVLSNRIFLEADISTAEKIRKELTYSIPNFNPKGEPLVLRTYARITDKILTIPIGRVDLIPADYEIIDKRNIIPAQFPEFSGQLRPSQQAIWEAIDDNAIINAWVSFGKTFTALAIAAKFKQKTLVVTHTVQLRNQWVREVEKVFGFTPDIIGSGKFGLSTPIVIGNVQTLYNRMKILYDKFGLVIVDETHHISAPTFSKVLDKSCARYKIGLSGTIERKDGKHVIFKDYLGTSLFQPPAENFMPPEIHIYKSSTVLPDGDFMPWAKKVNCVCYNEIYQNEVAILAAAYAAKGHKVLVVSDRVDLLKNCAELVGDTAVCITGETDHNQREILISKIKTGKKNVLFGTQSIFCEGISLNQLSCLILASPINNEPLLTQLIGRVIRLEENKLNPVIIDINLVGNTAKRQAQQRLGLYFKSGWKVSTI